MDFLCHTASKFLFKQGFTNNGIGRCGIVNLACKFCGADGNQKDCYPGGTPVIILHNFLGSKEHWDSITKRLAKSSGHPVVTVDARNHGESPNVMFHDYYLMARDLNKFIKKYVPTEEAMLIGHGMGGKTAIYLALVQPLRVRNIVVVDVSPITHPCVERKQFYMRLLDAMDSIKIGAKDIRGGISEAKYWLKKANVIDDERTMNFILSNIGEKPDRTIGWLCNVPILMKHLDEIFGFPMESSDIVGKKYHGPALFIAGQESCNVLPDDINGIEDLFPSAQLCFIQGAGHNLHEDCPEKFLELLCEFYKKNPIYE